MFIIPFSIKIEIVRITIIASFDRALKIKTAWAPPIRKDLRREALPRPI
jgi:hypothetical protein